VQSPNAIAAAEIAPAAALAAVNITSRCPPDSPAFPCGASAGVLAANFPVDSDVMSERWRKADGLASGVRPICCGLHADAQRVGGCRAGRGCGRIRT
jgi:hypothetical protein